MPEPPLLAGRWVESSKKLPLASEKTEGASADAQAPQEGKGLLLQNTRVRGKRGALPRPLSNRRPGEGWERPRCGLGPRPFRCHSGSASPWQPRGGAAFPLRQPRPRPFRHVSGASARLSNPAVFGPLQAPSARACGHGSRPFRRARPPASFTMATAGGLPGCWRGVGGRPWGWSARSQGLGGKRWEARGGEGLEGEEKGVESAGAFRLLLLATLGGRGCAGREPGGPTPELLPGDLWERTEVGCGSRLESRRQQGAVAARWAENPGAGCWTGAPRSGQVRGFLTLRTDLRRGPC